MKIKAWFFNTVSVLPYNLELGNVSSFITNETDLSSKFSFDVGDISYFNINGNDVQAFIETPLAGFYGCNTLAFAGTLITFTREYAGLWTANELQAFDNCDSLVEVLITAPAFNAGQRSYRSCSFLKPENFIVNTLDFTTTNLSAFENINYANSTFNLTAQTVVDNLGNSVRNMFRTATTTGVIDMRNVTSFILTGAGNIPHMFDNCNLKIRLWSCTTFMNDPSVSLGVFGIVATTKVIEINVAQQTANAGGVHQELVAAIALGATVIYTDSLGNPI